jgi:hypothetical protein
MNDRETTSYGVSVYNLGNKKSSPLFWRDGSEIQNNQMS